MSDKDRVYNEWAQKQDEFNQHLSELASGVQDFKRIMEKKVGKMWFLVTPQNQDRINANFPCQMIFVNNSQNPNDITINREGSGGWKISANSQEWIYPFGDSVFSIIGTIDNPVYLEMVDSIAPVAEISNQSINSYDRYFDSITIPASGSVSTIVKFPAGTKNISVGARANNKFDLYLFADDESQLPLESSSILVDLTGVEDTYAQAGPYNGRYASLQIYNSSTTTALSFDWLDFYYSKGD